MAKLKNIEINKYNLSLFYRFKRREFRVVHYDTIAMNESSKRVVHNDVYVVEMRLKYFNFGIFSTGWNPNWCRHFEGYYATNTSVHKTKDGASEQLQNIVNEIEVHTPLYKSTPTVVDESTICL